MATDRDLDRDVHADVEYAELGPDYARKVGEPIEGVRNRPAGPPELAEHDLLIGDLDKDGNGSQVFIAKGDPIPAGLRELPRHPARPTPRKR
jgi:hypothetical protein